MKTARTLEEFIKNYVDSIAPKKEKESYESWVSKNGINAQQNYQSALRGIDVEHAKGASEYGSHGEKIVSAGLRNSGYSAYLNSQQDKKYESAKADALQDYVKSTVENAQDYKAYSDAYDEKLEQQFTKIYDELTRDKVISYDYAYDYAKAAGLTPDNASVIAQNATATVINSLKENAISTAVKNSLSKEEARQYALALGLSYEDANEVAIFADSMRDKYSENKKTPEYTKDGYPIY